jgi:hypothetical protein
MKDNQYKESTREYKQKKNAGRGRRVFFSTKRPNKLWGRISFQFNVYPGSFPGIKWLGREVEQYLQKKCVKQYLYSPYTLS